MKILIVAGGTGGIYIRGLPWRVELGGHDVRFAVRRGDLGRDILQKEGFPVVELAGQGLPRTLSPRLLTFPFKFLQGWVEARTLLKSFRPDWVFGMGGYLSVPVILTARGLGLRTLLHEQNVLPGLANRFLSRWADAVAVSFPESSPYLKGKNVWVSGLPIRPDIGRVAPAVGRSQWGLGAKKTALVFGGSLGANRLNTAAVNAWPLLISKGVDFQVLHVTGTKDFERVEKLYHPLKIAAQVLPYCHAMAEAYAAADAVLCRAGASTVAELLMTNHPALLVPYAHASNNHQLYNAQIVEKNGQGRILLDHDLQPHAVADFFAQSFQKIRPPAVNGSENAARRLASYLTGSS